MRVFISHSSSDKDFFVRPLVETLKKNIGQQTLIFDELTFEKGSKINKQIDYWLEQTDLFVLLISNAALDSEWVIKEIMQSKYLEESNPLGERILPIIIDPNINFNDTRIPEWLQTYNIRTNRSPKKLASQILSKVIEISWEKNPKIREQNNLFVGRNKEMEIVEEKIDNFLAPRPNVLLASGIESIGRRSFLRNALIKLGITKQSYVMPSLQLDSHQSIEDFILKLDDSGYTDYDPKSLMKKSIDDKVNIVYELLKEFSKQQDILLVIDDGAIVTYKRNIADWFIKLTKKLQEENDMKDIVLYVISKFNPSHEKLYKYNNLVNVPIQELSNNEVASLLIRYSRLQNLNANRSDLESLSHKLTGFPDEVYFAVDLAKREGIERIKYRGEIFRDFSASKITYILEEYKENKEALQVCKLLSMFGFVSISTIYNLLQDKNYIEYIEDFIARGICSLIGTSSEYLIMNTAIKNHFSRQKITLPDVVTRNLKNYIASNLEDADYADKMFVLRNRMEDKKYEDIDEADLIPSLYLKTMKELYDSRKSDKDVIELADRVLNSSTFLDPYIIGEIRYFLCSALAREKNDRFKNEVQSIDGPQHTFLFGFYYRHIGQFEASIKKLEEVLLQHPNFPRAKRELVRVYGITENYEKALILAKENYEGNTSNEYHIHAYFNSVLSSKVDKISLEDKKTILSSLLRSISLISSDRAKNMEYCMKADYELHINNNISKAKQIIQEAEENFGDSIYLLLFKINLYKREANLEELNQVLKDMKGFNNHNSAYYGSYQKCRIYIETLNGNCEKAKKILSELKINENAKNRIRDDIEYLMQKEEK